MSGPWTPRCLGVGGIYLPDPDLSGCSGLSQRDHEVSTSVWAVGIPGVAVIKQSTISPDNRGEKDNTAIQSNPVSVSPRLK